MKVRRFAIILGLALSVASGARHLAFAGEGEPTTEGGESHGEGEHGPKFIKNSNSTVKAGKIERERPLERHERPVFEKEGAYYGSTKDGKPAKKGQGFKNQDFRDPVLAENDKGKTIIKEDPAHPRRDGKSANRWDKKTAAAHEADEKRFENMKGVTLISTPNVKDAVGINTTIGGVEFKDGRHNLAEGKYGEVNLDVGRVDYEGSAGLSVTNKGVVGQAGGRVIATLVGVQAETKTFGLGDPNGLNYAGGQLEGRAYIGGDAEADLKIKADTTGIAAQGELGGFLGGKVEGQAAGTVKICGVAVNLTGVAEASYGIGAKATGTFAIDWANMSVRIGAKASATLGGGLGAGGTIEVSLADVIKDPAAAAKCVADHLAAIGEAVYNTGKDIVVGAGELASKGIQKLGEGVSAIGSGLSSAGHAVSSFFGGLFGSDDPPAPAAPMPVAVAAAGTNVSRGAATIPLAPAAPAAPSQGDSGTQHGIDRN